MQTYQATQLYLESKHPARIPQGKCIESY